MATIVNSLSPSDAEAGRASRYGLDHHGLREPATVHWNLPPAELVEHAVRRGEGVLVAGGPFNAVTAPHTGRSPNDRFVVREPGSEEEIWWGAVNVPMTREHYAALRADVLAHLEGQDLFVRDMWAGADPDYRLAVRVVSSSAWHSLFAFNMFRRPTRAELDAMEPGFTVLHAPEMQAEPGKHGTRTGAFVVLNFARREVLIGGTRYAGEIKKSIFSVMNFFLPATRGAADALLRQPGPRGRRGALLRPLGHGQDDALGRPGARADRRRRARLERAGRSSTSRAAATPR